MGSQKSWTRLSDQTTAKQGKSVTGLDPQGCVGPGGPRLFPPASHITLQLCHLAPAWVSARSSWRVLQGSASRVLLTDAKRGQPLCFVKLLFDFCHLPAEALVWLGYGPRTSGRAPRLPGSYLSSRSPLQSRKVCHFHAVCWKGSIICYKPCFEIWLNLWNLF